MYQEIVDPKFTWKNFTIEEQDDILSSKRSNTYLDTTLLQSLLPKIKNIKDAVRYTLINYKI
jgi:3,5-epimerase/4-reductase